MSDVIVLSDDEEDAPSLAQRLLQRSGLATSTLSALSQADVQQPKLGAAARTGAAKSGKNTKAPAKRKQADDGENSGSELEMREEPNKGASPSQAKSQPKKSKSKTVPAKRRIQANSSDESESEDPG